MKRKDRIRFWDATDYDSNSKLEAYRADVGFDVLAAMVVKQDYDNSYIIGRGLLTNWFPKCYVEAVL
jgi:hypothetical protein